MECRKRVHPRLKNYNYASLGSYFITICVRDRAVALSDIVGRDDHGTPQCIIKLTNVGKIVDKYIKLIPENYKNVVLDNYVIMPDHIHLLISLKNGDTIGEISSSRPKRDDVCGDGVPRSTRPTVSISQIIGVMKRLINKETEKNIFQASFYDHIIRDEEDYITKYNYIENNPLKIIEKV